MKLRSQPINIKWNLAWEDDPNGELGSLIPLSSWNDKLQSYERRQSSCVDRKAGKEECEDVIGKKCP